MPPSFVGLVAPSSCLSHFEGAATEVSSIFYRILKVHPYMEAATT